MLNRDIYILSWLVCIYIFIFVCLFDLKIREEGEASVVSF